MNRLTLIAAILISSCAVPVQPVLRLPDAPPYEAKHILTADEEKQLRQELPVISEKLIRQKIGYEKRIETLEGIIRTTH